MTQYNPAPASLAARVIDFLKINGGTLTPNKIADLFEVQRSSVSNVLKAAVQAAALAHHAGGRGKTGYHLPGDEPVFEDEALAPATASPKKRKAKKAPGTPRNAREEEPAAAEVPPPIASLWDDGDLVLSGVNVNEDSNSVTLTDLQARQVHRFMERVYGPNE